MVATQTRGYRMIRVHGMSSSGNCYKVQLLIHQLQLQHEWIEVDSVNGGTRTAEFLAKNPNGKVPVLELDDGRCLPESNAILCYLANNTLMYPNNAWMQAQVLQWLFFEQYSHEPYIAVARFIKKYLPANHERHADLPRLHQRGYQALDVMEKHLSENNFFANSAYSVADIALFAYTHDAATGGFDLTKYPNIQAWLSRVRAQPGYLEQKS
jgi:glutathione S-transferase